MATKAAKTTTRAPAVTGACANGARKSLPTSWHRAHLVAAAPTLTRLTSTTSRTICGVSSSKDPAMTPIQPTTSPTCRPTAPTPAPSAWATTVADRTRPRCCATSSTSARKTASSSSGTPCRCRTDSTAYRRTPSLPSRLRKKWATPGSAWATTPCVSSVPPRLVAAPMYRLSTWAVLASTLQAPTAATSICLGTRWPST